MKIFKIMLIVITVILLTGCSTDKSVIQAELVAGSETTIGSADRNETSIVSETDAEAETSHLQSFQKKSIPDRKAEEPVAVESIEASTEITAEPEVWQEPIKQETAVQIYEAPPEKDIFVPESEERTEPVPVEQETEAQTEEPVAINPAPTESGTTQQETQTETVHEHNWEAITETVHHDAVTEEVRVVDKPAWDEVVEKQVPITEEVFIRVATCRMCGAAFESEDLDVAVSACHSHIRDVHDNACGYGLEESYYRTIQTGTETVQDVIHHEEEYHFETVTISEAWDEEVITGYRCSTCGEQKN